MLVGGGGLGAAGLGLGGLALEPGHGGGAGLGGLRVERLEAVRLAGGAFEAGLERGALFLDLGLALGVFDGGV